MDSAQARRLRVSLGPDDLVDGADARRGAGRQVLDGVLVGQAPALLAGSARRRQRPPVHDADGLLGAHDPELGAGPREVEIRAEVLGVHRDVGAAERLAQHDREARHGRLGERVQQLRAVPDHARSPPGRSRAGSRACRRAPPAEPRTRCRCARTARPSGTRRRRSRRRGGAAGWRRCRPARPRSARTRSRCSAPTRGEASSTELGVDDRRRSRRARRTRGGRRAARRRPGPPRRPARRAAPPAAPPRRSRAGRSAAGARGRSRRCRWRRVKWQTPLRPCTARAAEFPRRHVLPRHLAHDGGAGEEHARGLASSRRSPSAPASSYPPPAEVPVMTEICGTSPDIATCSLKIRA